MIMGWTRWLRPLSLGLAFSFGGCASDDGTMDRGAVLETGELRLSLVGANQSNYRLRNAEFSVKSVYNASSFVLSSDTDPEAVAITRDLPQDSYTITLRDGWVVEHLVDGSWVTARGALVTENPLSFQIAHGVTTALVYSFAVDGGTITFGEGSLGLSVDVVDPGGLASCDLLGATCPSQQTCLLADATGKTFCAEPGTLPVGSPCDSEQCVAGSQCLSLDPANPGQATCTRFCSPTYPPLGCDCRSLSFSPDIGVCVPSGNRVEFMHEFTYATTEASCTAWNGFRSQLVSGSYSRVVMNGTYSVAGITCNDPALATQICNDLANGTASSVVCEGRSWNVGYCGIQNSAGEPAVELSVDSPACSCSNFSARPCTDVPYGGGSFGGVGIPACYGYPQTLRVACELAQ